MVEFIFALYLLSGLFKSFMLFFIGNLFIIDLTLLCSIILVGVYIIDSFKNAYFKNEFFLPHVSRSITLTTLIFYLWMIVSLLYTQSPRYCYVKTILFFTCLLALLFPLLYKKFDPRRFFKCFAYLGSALVIMYSVLLPNLYAMYSRTGINKDFVVKYLDVGYIAGIVILMLVFACPGMNRLIKVILIGLNAWGILISSARGPLLFLVFVLLMRLAVSAYLLLKKKWEFNFKNMMYSCVGLGVLAGLAYVMIGKYSELLERTLSRFSRLTDTASGGISVRLSQVSFSIDTIFEKASNFLFGMGIGSFGVLFDGVDSRRYPHNMILEIAFELGLIGILLFLMLLFLCFYKIRRSFNFVLIYIFLLLNSLKSYSMVDSRIVFGVLGVLVIMVYTAKERKATLGEPGL